MSNFNVRFPDSLYSRLKELAEKNGTSINPYIVMAVAKEIGREEAKQFYQSRTAKAASPEEFFRLLRKAPDIEPENLEDHLD